MNKEEKIHEWAKKQKWYGKPIDTCPVCLKSMKKVIEKGKWDGHTYNCLCKPEIYVSIG